MKKVYISHPYASDPAGNTAKVDLICRDLVASGKVLPISPIHLFSFTDDSNRRGILEVCMALVLLADELWVYGLSAGVILEIGVAKDHDIPVVYKVLP